ncbi:MAG TPA: TaqI-like C-terminal specificity domain-containing protein [Herpetosiphonaceae bacterium]|nr:TaqI-like C-terminal specificity domain-containing protein [Herpetosiphonaceae bacterium]
MDYRDLDERHLGTIYEGLLEYHLQPVPREGDWTVALLNDKGERKATGSYYTPDYVVKYIVDQTVGPVLRAAVAGLDTDAAKIAAVLRTNVLDPAMGSGHFLVEVTEYIARFLVDLAVVPGADAGGEADLQYWKRRVVQSCVYGVDLNPLAVELAKLSLWLSTVAKDRPLSFLDHHLRTGNALVGARIADLQVGSGGAGAQKRRKQAKQAAAGQLSMLDDESFRQSMSTAVDSMWLIEGSAGLTVAEVKEQERIYAGLRETLTRKYGRLADLVTATHFGLEVDATMWQPLADFATGRTVAALPKFTAWLQQADAIAGERRFFHWELEFPEVFFDRHGQPLGEQAGFDAVVGNPPYLNAWTMTDRMATERDVLKDLFGRTGLLEGHWDLYVPFIIQSLMLGVEGGFHSFIVPNPVLREKYATSLRNHLLTQHSVESILSFDETNVFDEVSRQCIVYVAKIGSSPVNMQSIRIARDVGQTSYEEVAVVDSSVWLGAYNYQIRHDPNYVVGLPILRRVENISDLLGQYLYVNVGATVSSKDPGVFTKDNVISHVPQGHAHKFFDGTNVRRWNIRWEQIWLDYRRELMSGPRSPEMFESKKILVRIRTAENERLIAAYDDTGMYCDHTVIVCCPYDALRGSNAKTAFLGFEKLGSPLDQLYVLALLNSFLMTWVFRNKFATGALQGSFSDVWPQSVRSFPIRRIAFTTPPEERERLQAKGQALYQQFCTKDDYACVLGFVEHHLPRLPDGTPDTANEHSDVVHDLLAYLAEQMIDLNKQRQTAVENLILDLEGLLSPGDMQKIGRLWTPPGATNAEDAAAVKKRAEAQQELGSLAEQRLELRDHIGAISENQWKWLLKGWLKHITNLADLVRVYRQRQPAVAALDHRLAATDQLIDRIVYALYGLSDDEIAIVEGKSGVDVVASS